MPTTTTAPTAMGPSSATSSSATSSTTTPAQRTLAGLTGPTGDQPGQPLASPPGFPVGGGLSAAGEKEECPHCRHVDILWAERAEHRQAATLLNVKVESLAVAFQMLCESTAASWASGPGGEGAGGCSGGQRFAQPNASPHGCHCRCLDAVNRRLAEVEQHLRDSGDYVRRIASLELQTAALAARAGAGAGTAPGSSTMGPATAPGPSTMGPVTGPAPFLSGGCFNGSGTEAFD